MDDQKTLLINLSKGVIGEGASNLLGVVLLHSIGLASFSEAYILKKDRKSLSTDMLGINQ